MEKNWKVIIPTLMVRKTKPIEGKPGYFERYEVHSKYEYTLAEALVYMQNHAYYLTDVILYNVCLRNQLRKLGAQALVDELSKMVEPNKDLKRAMTYFVDSWQDKQIADFDIQFVSIYEDLDFGFTTVSGLQELKSMVEKSIYRDGDIDSRKEAQGGLIHAGEVWDSYPVFDSGDLGDNRTYQNYIIRDRPITYLEMRAIACVHSRYDYCKLHETTPEDLLPMVYYRGDGGFMLMAKKLDEFHKMAEELGSL